MRKPNARTLAAWSALLVAQRRITDQLDAELREAVDITLDEYDILLQLRRSRRLISMSELAERVLITRASLTRLVDGLVEREWVDRWDDDADRSRVLVGLTDEGREAHAEAAEYHLDGIARLVQRPLRGHDVDALAAALRALSSPPGSAPGGA